MTLSIEIPDNIAQRLEADGTDPQRRALEILALELYRESQVSSGEVGMLLGLSFHETEEFLKKHGAEPHYGFEEYLEDIGYLRSLRS